MIELLKTQRVHDKILLAVQTRQIYTRRTQLVLINSLLEALPHHPVGWIVFNVPFQHKYGYIRDERSGVAS